MLQGISPLDLYGVNNLRLSQLEKGFPGVKLIARGEELKIRGNEDKVAQLKSLLITLIEEARKKGRISEHRFQELLMPGAASAGAVYDPEADDSVLVHGSGGLMVKPKTAGQRQMVATALEKDIVFAVGPAGTGKTYMAVAMAVRALKEKSVKKIILCRPAVDAGESLGFLPGDMKEKVDPYLRPLYDALEDMIHSEKLKYYLANNIIEIAPLAFMRGRTLNHAFVIMDEAQNATSMQMKMFLTRLGEHSRMIITGDDTQIDLPIKQKSGLIHSIRLLNGITGIGFVRLNASDVVRHKLVRDILAAYEHDDTPARD